MNKRDMKISVLSLLIHELRDGVMSAAILTEQEQRESMAVQEEVAQELLRSIARLNRLNRA